MSTPESSTAGVAGGTTTLDIHGPDGDSAGTIELPADVFDAKANLALMHQVVVAQLAARRAGTHKTKTRGEVSGGGAKPYRQKGTGRARQGSTRAPQFEGGGVVHGPQPRDYSQRTPKKMKAAALRGALSDRARSGRLHVVSSFVGGDAPSTSGALDVLGRALADVERSQRVLVVLHPTDRVSWKSLRNLSAVHLLDSGQLNTYDVLVSDDVVFTEDALRDFLDAQAARRNRRGTRSDLAAPTVDDVIVDTDEAVTHTDTDTDDADTDTHPDGAGSHAALPDDSAPEGFDIKGNASSKLFHVPGSAFYDRTVAEVWFATTDDAERAGFSRPKSQQADTDTDSQDSEEGA